MAEKMKFRCTLLTDVILSQTSSTEGNQYCLDFIPGNNFLGIAAGRLYKALAPAEALAVFHSGQVRFGDAHPALGDRRTLKVPGAMFYPKLKKASEECYIHHLIPNPDDEIIKGKQLKQCREGFYAFGCGNRAEGRPVRFGKNYAIKSAYDADKRRSRDGQLFGYQSLPEGLVLYFEVESGLGNPMDRQIADALVGTRHIGRSRTAQYGLVKIEEAEFGETPSGNGTFGCHGKRYATVYADGRLIFLDSDGEPSFRPTAADLGFAGKNDRIDWAKSQVRTFQYSPWNGKRNTYDTDRCGIEKGSVLVVECEESPSSSAYVGAYRNEGFGKVIYNPDFLDGDADGRARYKLSSEDPDARPSAPAVPTPAPDGCVRTPLLAYLRRQEQQAVAERSVYQDVNAFVNEHARRFSGERFASQWGSIRSIAMIEPAEDKIKDCILRFLDHGVAKEKWEEQGRRAALEKFMNIPANLRSRIINLASEMAKRCRKEGKTR